MKEVHEFKMTSEEQRLFEMGAFGFIAVNQYVNVNDLINAMEPGAIVRCERNPSECIQFFPSMGNETLGCVAGWISEDEHGQA